MKREDYLFTIGFKDDESIVDKRWRAKYKGLSTVELYEAGLYKPAAASALWEAERGDRAGLEELIRRFKRDFGDEYSEQSLRRDYGLTQKPLEAGKVLAF